MARTAGKSAKTQRKGAAARSAEGKPRGLEEAWRRIAAAAAEGAEELDIGGMDAAPKASTSQFARNAGSTTRFPA
jgi:hypothetical protein